MQQCSLEAHRLEGCGRQKKHSRARGAEFPFVPCVSFFEVFCIRDTLLQCFFNGLEGFWDVGRDRMSVAFCHTRWLGRFAIGYIYSRHAAPLAPPPAGFHSFWLPAPGSEALSRPRQNIGGPETGLGSKLKDAMLRPGRQCEVLSRSRVRRKMTAGHGVASFSSSLRSPIRGLGLLGALFILTLAYAISAQGPDRQQLFREAYEAPQRGDQALAVRKYQELIRASPRRV